MCDWRYTTMAHPALIPMAMIAATSTVLPYAPVLRWASKPPILVRFGGLDCVYPSMAAHRSAMKLSRSPAPHPGH